MRIRRYFTLTSTVAAFLVAASAAIAEDERPQVTVDTGTLAGTLEAGSRIFRGIPYAAAPIDELRWKEPQPVSAWNGVRDASRFGDRCQQTRFQAYIPIGNRGMSENCLYLNVWSAPGAMRRPVIVWIHGGGFAYGFSNQAAYDGSAFVQKGLVYVSLNYRVGAFGFLAHPDLTQESPNKSSGNYAILDQIAALQWVKRNIAAFGGDPDNVTIFGESAGSISVNILTASPLARGLFNRAIGDSGAGLGTTIDTLPVRPLAWAEQRGVRFAGVLRARTVEELRSVPAAEIADVGEHGPGVLFNASRHGPNIDGYLLPEAPADIYARGAQNNVELIAGWNLREANIFHDRLGTRRLSAEWNSARTPETFMQLANRSFGADAAAFLGLHPHANDAEAGRSAEDVASDLIINWPTWKWADLQSAQRQDENLCLSVREDAASRIAA